MKYSKIIAMATEALAAAWPEEVSADQKIDKGLVKELSHYLNAELVKTFQDKAADHKAKVTELVAEFAEAIINGMYPDLVAKGRGSVAKNEELFANLNKSVITETNADLVNAIFVHENTGESPEEAAQPEVKNPAGDIKHYNGPIWNSTPTFGEQLVGAKFNPDGVTHVDHIKSRIANVIDMLNDLRTKSEFKDQVGLSETAIGMLEEAAKIAVNAFEIKY